MRNSNTNGQLGGDELKPSVSLFSTYRAVDSPWPPPPFPSSGPCCSPWMYTVVCTQINTHTYTHVCLSYLVCAPDSSFHRFQACPRLGITAIAAWALWSIPWALGVSEKRLWCLSFWDLLPHQKRKRSSGLSVHLWNYFCGCSALVLTNRTWLCQVLWLWDRKCSVDFVSKSYRHRARWQGWQ